MQGGSGGRPSSGTSGVESSTLWSGGQPTPHLRSAWSRPSCCGFSTAPCLDSPPDWRPFSKRLRQQRLWPWSSSSNTRRPVPQEATQRKLDEILRASPDADNSLITLEEAPDSELKAATEAHRDARRDTRGEGPS